VRALVVYDTVHGNTEQVARAIGDGLGEGWEVRVLKAAAAGPEDVLAADLVIVGTPTHAWNMTGGGRAFCRRLRGERYTDKLAAAFDTKIEGRFTGSAARKLARALGRLGFRLAASPESFYVRGMEGPLREGELERARSFGESLATAARPGG